MSTVSPGQLAWLEGELAGWQADGLVTVETAEAIRARYVASRRFSLITLLLGLGAAFVAAGLIWLVAANLDRLSPLLRFVVVTALWLGLVVAAEALAERRQRTGDRASPVVGAARLLAAAAFGAVVFQAAQSLQVPAYSASLVGWWGLGALLYAYAVAGVAPLMLGVAVSAVWFTWQSADAADGVLGFVAAMLFGAVAASAVAVTHGPHRRPYFAPPWRVWAAFLALLGLFVAALPGFSVPERRGWSLGLTISAVVVALALVGTALIGDRVDRAELGLVSVATLGGIGLVAWPMPEDLTEALSAQTTARAVIAVLVYLVLAGAYAVLGTRRDLPALTWLATASLVLFTTVQSFAVFAPITSGATLFLLLGLVLLVTGYLVDRGRRRLIAELATSSPSSAADPGDAP